MITTTPGTPGTILFAFKPSTFGGMAFTLFVGTIAVTYTLCAFVEDYCPKFLPTISDTWVPAPGNYISRIAVSLGCIYWLNTKSRPQPSAGLLHVSNGFLLGMAVVSIFLLSWIIYNVYMLLLAFLPRTPSLRGKAFLVTLALLSTACKVRLLPPVAAMLGSSALAIVEWADVALIAVYTVYFLLSHCQAYAVGWFQIAPPTAPATASAAALSEKQRYFLVTGPTTSNCSVLTFFSAQSIALVALSLLVAVFGVTWIVAVKLGDVAPNTLPVIEDLWISPPNNWISRWGIVLTGSCLGFVEVALYFIRTSEATTSAGKVAPAVLLAVGIVSSLAFALIGAINVYEDNTVHGLVVLTFFILYDVYLFGSIVLAFLRGRFLSDGLLLGGMLAVSLYAMTRFCCVAAWAFTHLCHADASRFETCAQWSMAARGALDVSHLAVLQWIHYALVAVLLVVNVFFSGNAKTGAQFGLGLVEIPSTKSATKC